MREIGWSAKIKVVHYIRFVQATVRQHAYSRNVSQTELQSKTTVVAGQLEVQIESIDVIITQGPCRLATKTAEQSANCPYTESAFHRLLVYGEECSKVLGWARQWEIHVMYRLFWVQYRWTRSLLRWSMVRQRLATSPTKRRTAFFVDWTTTIVLGAMGKLAAFPIEIPTPSPQRCLDLSQQYHHVGKQYSRLRVGVFETHVLYLRLTKDVRLNLSLPLVIRKLGCSAHMAIRVFCIDMSTKRRRHTGIMGLVRHTLCSELIPLQD